MNESKAMELADRLDRTLQVMLSARQKDGLMCIWEDDAKNVEDAVAALRRPSPPQAEAGTLETLIREYARDLRRNSSGGDDYPWEYAKATADYLETLIARSAPAPQADVRAALERYGRHEDNCEEEMWHGKGPMRCSCGFHETLAALSAPLSVGEPVAWQLRFPLSDGGWSDWQCVVDHWDLSRNPDWQYRPLYAAPPPSVALDARTIEACAKVADNWLVIGRGPEIAKAIRALSRPQSDEGSGG